MENKKEFTKEQMQESKAEILFFICFIIILLSFIFLTINNINEAKEDLRICKSLGYDGVKFVGKYTKELECANFTALEKSKKLGVQEK